MLRTMMIAGQTAGAVAIVSPLWQRTFSSDDVRRGTYFRTSSASYAAIVHAEGYVRNHPFVEIAANDIRIE